MPERQLKLEGTFNTRDLGGYRGANNRPIRWHRLYRSDDLFHLTDHDIAILTNLRLSRVIDFRNAQELQNRPDRLPRGVAYSVLSPADHTAALASASLHSDKEKIDRLIAAEERGELNLSVDGLKDSMIDFVTNPPTQNLYRQVLEFHVMSSHEVILQHCRGGKDRTGYGAALVLLALGVAEADVVADYMLTAQYNQTRNARRMAEYRQYTDNVQVLAYLARAMATRQEVIEAGLAEMKRLGGTYMGYITNVLGFPAAAVAEMRRIYLL